MTQQIRYRHTRPTQRTNRRSVRWTEREREDLARMAPTRSCSRRGRRERAPPGTPHTLPPLTWPAPCHTTHSAPLRWRSHPETTPGSFPTCMRARTRPVDGGQEYVRVPGSRETQTPPEREPIPRAVRGSHAPCPRALTWPGPSRTSLRPPWGRPRSGHLDLGSGGPTPRTREIRVFFQQPDPTRPKS
jgi:hypothetical protein